MLHAHGLPFSACQFQPLSTNWAKIWPNLGAQNITPVAKKKKNVQGLDDRYDASWISYHVQVITSASSLLAFSFLEADTDI